MSIKLKNPHEDLT